MTIPAKRYKFLDQETNVAISDFFKGDNLSTLNLPGLNLKSITNTLSSFLNSNSQNGEGGLLNTLQSKFTELTDRVTTGVGLNFKDLKGLSLNNVSGLIDKSFGGNLNASSIFNKLPDKYKNLLTSKLSLDMDDNSGKTTDSITFVSALNKILPTSLPIPSFDRNDKLSSITGLSSVASSLGVPDVFKSLIGGVDKDLISRASGELSHEFVNKKDFNGLIDLGNSDNQLNTVLSNPGVINSIISNFSIPSGFNEGMLKPLGDSLFNALGSFDNNWNKSSETENVMSVSGISSSDDFKKILNVKLNNNIPDTDDLNVVNTDDSIFLSCCLG